MVRNGVLRLAAGLMVAAGVASADAQEKPYSRLYVFGDSYSDTGAGYVDGNGPTAVAYMAERLGIPFTYAGDPKATKDESLNYAVSGAQTGAGAGRRYPGGEFLGYGMRNQVDDFAKAIHDGKIHFAPAETMFFFAGGLNDRNLTTETTIANIEGEMETLYGLGARRFTVALLPVAIPGFGAMGQRLNEALGKIPADMRAKHPGVEVATSRWGLDFDEVLTHPAQYGMTNTKDACAGRTLHNEDPTPCATPGTYVFYHGGHPSTATHKLVGTMLAEEVVGRPAKGSHE